MRNQQAMHGSIMLAPITAATTERTANLDCQGADYATIQIVLGAEANTNSTNVVVSLKESDDTTATNFATFNADYNQTLDNATATIALYHVALKGRKRYLRVTVTPDTTTNGAVLSCVSALLNKEVKESAITNFSTYNEVG